DLLGLLLLAGELLVFPVVVVLSSAHGGPPGGGWVMLTWCVCASATGAAHGEMEKAPPSEEDGATVLTQRGERSSQGRRPRPHHIPVSMYAVSPTSAAFQSHSSIFHTEPGTASSGRSGQKFPAISDPGCTSAYSSIEPSQASCVEYST